MTSPSTSPSDGVAHLIDRSKRSGTREVNEASSKGKGKARTRESNAYGSSPIQSLPLECLAHVFAHLPPRELGTCQLVCRAWNAVVDDEASWRTAFETYYGVNPQSLGRRMEPASWRTEYTTRVALMRQWHRSRTPTVIHNPSLGAISSIHIQLPTITPPLVSRSTNPAPARRDSITPSDLTLLSVSLPLGAAVHSIPFTGKLSKRALLASPIDHLGRPQGLPMIGVTSFAVSHDGNRLIWGMRDGSIRVSNSAPSGGRGAVGSTIDQGEVRQIEEAHREGTSIQLLSFSNVGGTGRGKSTAPGGLKQRSEVFVSVGKDGIVSIWTTTVPPVPGARERAPPAVKLWSSKWDVKTQQPVSDPNRAGPTAADIARSRVKATAVAFDSGWIGRQRGRKASVAVGRSDGKVVFYPDIDLPEGSGVEVPPVEPIVLEVDGRTAIDTLVIDASPTPTGSTCLLVHSTDATTFSRYSFSPSQTIGPPSFTHTLFGHPLEDNLASLTSIAIDFDEPPPPPISSHPATPAGDNASISIVPPRIVSLSSSAFPPSLSRTSSELTIPSTPTSAALDASFGSNRFGRRKYVVGGDDTGRVFLWDWHAEPEQDGNIVGPAKVVQGLEVEGGGSASKVTALEITEGGIFVGGLDGTLRFYSTLGPPTTPQPPIRTFRDRSAPRHPARLLAQGIVAEDDAEKWLVSHIRANRECVVAAIGGRVLAWRTEAIVKKKGGFSKGGKMTARQERFKANIDLQHQVRESMSALSAESSARVERFEQEHRLTSEFGLPPSLDTLTEEEAVAFAMILSAEEEERKMVAIASDNGKGREVSEAGDSDEEWEQPPDEWLADDFVWLDEDYDNGPSTSSLRKPSRAVNLDDYEDYDETSRATSRGDSLNQSLSTSLNVPSSPFLRGSSIPNGSPSPSPRSYSTYGWKPVSASSSPSLHPLNSPSPSNAKLQISPSLGPTYGSSYSNYANDPVPDMDPSLWPAANSSATSPPPSADRRRSSFASSQTSASPSPALPPSSLPASSSATANGSTTPLRRGWSQVARASPSPSTPSSAAPSPSISSPWPTSKPMSSFLADQLRASSTSSRGVAEEEEDRRRRREEEDLKFAIEMSLAEETSRMEL